MSLIAPHGGELVDCTLSRDDAHRAGELASITLSPREQTILQLRFGLTGGDEKTLEEVGQQFGVTRERIRQIQDEALRKLRKRIEKRDKKKDEIAQAA